MRRTMKAQVILKDIKDLIIRWNTQTRNTKRTAQSLTSTGIIQPLILEGMLVYEYLRSSFIQSSVYMNNEL